MTPTIFKAFLHLAVPELVHAASAPPSDLQDEERALYVDLLERERGRLEQEFLPSSLVEQVLREWSSSTINI